MNSVKKIKVLVVDDSAVVRQTMTDILESDPSIEVIDTASDPFIAVEKIRKVIPDVITLDVEMPRMDGVTFLHKIMTQHPIPVVMCSSLTDEGAETTLRALEYGAVDIITKPKMGVQRFLEESQIRICDSVKAASQAKLALLPSGKKHHRPSEKLTADVMLAPPTGKAMLRTTEKIIAVGASTGGTEALRIFLESMPQDAPGIAIVQHMPENFTKAFAKRLDGICSVNVKEAEDGDTIIRGRALIAPGNKHMLIKRSGARYYVEVKEGPLVSRHRPSVDVLFRSAAEYSGANTVGVIMTGMGDDGARGMLEMKQAGAYNIAQDEKSCVVFGMPNEAIKLGAVDAVLPLNSIAGGVLKECSK
jgi:two-component system chemotaxis response regulator CheB